VTGVNLLRQSHPEQNRPNVDFLHALTETPEVCHIYILEDWPGPSAHLFVDGVFARWYPGLTYERAALHGDRL
jgi:hypothetical protein